MKTVVQVASKNPSKIASVRAAFESFFSDVSVEGIEVDSGVSGQPFGDDTFKGAKNRVENLRKRHAVVAVEGASSPSADFFVGLEGGVAEEFGKHFVFAVASVASSDGRNAFGQSARFELPDEVVLRLKEGAELGVVMDEWANAKNLKHTRGAVGLLTGDRIDRMAYNRDAVLLALSVLLHPKWNNG
jgi:inosine/xanthosine triphosphatase